MIHLESERSRDKRKDHHLRDPAARQINHLPLSAVVKNIFHEVDYGTL
jgi:hypothetical protein